MAVIESQSFSELANRGNTLDAYEAIDFLQEHLCKSMAAFEYGSGGSTIFFASRVKFLVSIEHHPGWHKTISRALKQKKIYNCQYELCEPEPLESRSRSHNNSMDFRSREEEYKAKTFEKYVKSIEGCADETFDFVSIDGRARSSCVLQSYKMVRSGGFLLLDDSEREYYRRGTQKLDDWERIDFFGPKPLGRRFGQTSIWRKP